MHDGIVDRLSEVPEGENLTSQSDFYLAQPDVDAIQMVHHFDCKCKHFSLYSVVIELLSDVCVISPHVDFMGTTTS